MTALVLPTRTDVARYDFDIELEGNSYRFDFEWNDRDSSWCFSISDTAGNTILSGRKVVLHYPLINVYRDARLPAGSLEAIDTSSTDIEPGFADLGDRVKLLYVPKADL